MEETICHAPPHVNPGDDTDLDPHRNADGHSGGHAYRHSDPNKNRYADGHAYRHPRPAAEPRPGAIRQPQPGCIMPFARHSPATTQFYNPLPAVFASLSLALLPMLVPSPPQRTQLLRGPPDKPTRRDDHTYARHVEWMRTLVFDVLDLNRVTLVCQDWGGLLGLRLVGEHPDRFARVVAANTFLPVGDRSPGDAFLAWQRFSQEARIATQIKHPNVAILYDFSRLEDGSFYMVWEHIEGEDVGIWLRARGPFPIQLALDLGDAALTIA